MRNNLIPRLLHNSTTTVASLVITSARGNVSVQEMNQVCIQYSQIMRLW